MIQKVKFVQKFWPQNTSAKNNAKTLVLGKQTADEYQQTADLFKQKAKKCKQTVDYCKHKADQI